MLPWFCRGVDHAVSMGQELLLSLNNLVLSVVREFGEFSARDVGSRVERLPPNL